jgi:hypothetical protein
VKPVIRTGLYCSERNTKAPGKAQSVPTTSPWAPRVQIAPPQLLACSQALLHSACLWAVTMDGPALVFYVTTTYGHQMPPHYGAYKTSTAPGRTKTHTAMGCLWLRWIRGPRPLQPITGAAGWNRSLIDWGCMSSTGPGDVPEVFSIPGSPGMLGSV